MLGLEEKKRRTFSESFKREKVQEIETKKITIAQISRIYEVSRTAVHKWVILYSSLKFKGERIVVEKVSEAIKTERLLLKVKELEQLVGQKQVEIEYLSKVIELGSELTGMDIKKKFVSKS